MLLAHSGFMLRPSFIWCILPPPHAPSTLTDTLILIRHGVYMCVCISKTLSPKSYLIAKNNVLVNCFINYLS